MKILIYSENVLFLEILWRISIYFNEYASWRLYWAYMLCKVLAQLFSYQKDFKKTYLYLNWVVLQTLINEICVAATIKNIKKINKSFIKDFQFVRFNSFRYWTHCFVALFVCSTSLLNRSLSLKNKKQSEINNEQYTSLSISLHFGVACDWSIPCLRCVKLFIKTFDRRKWQNSPFFSTFILQSHNVRKVISCGINFNFNWF